MVPTATTRSERFKELFFRYRAGGTFIKALLVFLALWFCARYWFPFDPDNGWLNLILSAEASIATALLLDMQLKQTAIDRATFNEIQEEVEEIHEELVDHEAADYE